jgi:hypothetical protein
MDLNSFHLLKEDHDSYHIAHPKGKSLVIAKKGLHQKAHDVISRLPRQALEEGGAVESETPEEAAPEQAPAQQPTDQQWPQMDIPSFLKPNPAAVQTPITGDQAEGKVESSEPTPGMIGEKAGSVQQALEAQKESIADIGQAKSKESAANAAALKKLNEDIGKQKTPAQKFADYTNSTKKLEDAYRNKIIDPDRFYKNMDVPTKIAAGIGMILSGIGSGLTGQPNMALQMIQRQVDQDIEAQKADKEGALNLYRMNRERMQDDQAADLATKNQIYAGVKYKMEENAARMGTTMALAQAKQQGALIDQQIAQNNYQMALINKGMGVGTPGQFSGEDPSILVPQLIKEPGAQKAALEEISRAQNIEKNGQKIVDAFDRASKENTVLRTGAGLLRTPGSVMALHQLMLPNFKSIDGTVRQAAMDESFHNLTPAPGDTEEKIAEKRQALQDWLHSETAAPTAKAHGIDLSKFSTTAVQESAANPKVRMFMKQNPGVTEAQATTILQKYGKL